MICGESPCFALSLDAAVFAYSVNLHQRCMLEAREKILGRLIAAMRCFLSILFKGEIPADIVSAFGLEKRSPAEAAVAPVRATDGALQLLGILQRDARLVDFLMEDISGYADDQVGAAVRGLHAQSRQSLTRYVRLAPLIDGVEGSFTKLDVSAAPDPSRVKLLGNVPADGRAAGGVLRHKGWRAEKAELPPLDGRQDVSIIAPAEIEIE